MIVLRAALSGLIAFTTVVILVVVGSYLRCLAEGIPYNFFIAISIAMKSGTAPGIAIFILTLIGAPRRRPPF